jgi:hypothetical protein
MWIRWAFLALLLFLAASSPVNSLEVPVPPPPDTAISWDVHRSLGVVLVFNTDKGKLYFAHPIVMSHAVPDCQSIIIQPKGNLINITDINTTSVPMRHIVLRQPIAFRYEGEDWQSPYQSTFHE